MNRYHTTHHVAHSPRQMFDLVARIEDYPQFLPMCEALSLRSRDTAPNGGEIVIADMSVGYGPINETFTSKVTLDPAAQTVLVEYLDGPFTHLENRWGFAAADGGGCDVDFFIEYEFRSRMLQMLMGAMFEQAFGRFVAAFEARAVDVYGPAGETPATA